MLSILHVLLLTLWHTQGARSRPHIIIGTEHEAKPIQHEKGQQVNVQYLPCRQEGCQKGTEGKVLAFSALHDVTLKEVALFVDIAFKDDPDEEEVQCLFWSEFHEGDTPIKVPGKAVRIFDNKHVYAPYVVKCSDPVPQLRAMPLWAGLALDDEDTQVRLLVEKVGLQQKGVVGACNGVINSDMFELTYEWLHYYTKLGVEGFLVYITRQSVQWTSKDWSRPLADEDTLNPFSFPGVSWMQFEHLSIDDRFLFSQTTIYNDCVYRLRHEYQYLMMLDIDEYLILKDPQFTRKTGLQTFLHQSFPTQGAALGIFRYAYRNDCNGMDVHSDQPEVYHERFTHRLKDSESKTVLGSNQFADKLIIKPDRVDIFYMHFLRSARTGFSATTTNVAPSIAFVKHLRHHGHDCAVLTEDDPS